MSACATHGSHNQRQRKGLDQLYTTGSATHVSLQLYCYMQQKIYA